MRTQTVILKKPHPYFMDHYNVEAFTAQPHSHIHSMLARTNNALVKATQFTYQDTFWYASMKISS